MAQLQNTTINGILTCLSDILIDDPELEEMLAELEATTTASEGE